MDLESISIKLDSGLVKLDWTLKVGGTSLSSIILSLV